MLEKTEYTEHITNTPQNESTNMHMHVQYLYGVQILKNNLKLLTVIDRACPINRS